MSNKRKLNDDYFNQVNNINKHYISEYNYLYNKLLDTNQKLDLLSDNITNKLQIIFRDINLLSTYINYKISFLENKINLYEKNTSFDRNNYNYYS